MVALAGLPMVIMTIGAILLCASGVSKVARPLALARALYAVALPSSFAAVRFVGAGEVLVGVTCLAGGVTGGTTARVAATLVAATYAAFAAFLAWLLTMRDGAGSCGCAGSTDVPPTWLHASADTIVALAALAAAVSGPRLSLISVQHPTSTSLVGVCLVGLAAYLTYLAFLRAHAASALKTRS